jgi:hypothetical protein
MIKIVSHLALGAASPTEWPLTSGVCLVVTITKIRLAHFSA